MEDTKELIKRRRRQLLIHSYLYYDLGETLIEDSTFDKWAYELVELQNKYPELSKEVKDFYWEFIDFDGCSGFDLNYRHPDIVNVALRLLRNKSE